MDAKQTTENGYDQALARLIEAASEFGMWAMGAHLESPGVDRVAGIREAAIEQARETADVSREAVVVGMEADWLEHAADVLHQAAGVYREHWTAHALELARVFDELERQTR
jgi:hypothetical protein